MKVAICAGHGMNTPGKRTPDDEREWSFNNKVVLAAITVLKASGCEILRTDDPTGKTDVGLTARTNAANTWKADVYVSVHHNAMSFNWFNGSGGVETYTYLGSQPESERLAKEVHGRIVSAMGLRDRGLKKANFAIVRQTNMPAILTEGGFMDSRVDIVAMRNDDRLKAQGVAIAEGVIAYLGGKVTIPNDTKTGGIIVENKPPSKPSKKTIAQMADEVIAQKHGNGHENRRKSLGISKAEYEKVRAEVNRREGVGVSKPAAKPTKEYVQLPASAQTWRTYKTNVQPVAKNSDWSLTPGAFGGLEYEILARPQKDVVTISTGRGRRNIYVGSNTSARIIRK